QNIFVQDTTAPTLALNGLNFLTIALGATYTDAGVSVTDNVDTGLVATVSGSVNTNIVGSYTLTYYVTDSAGNAVVQIRTVDVIAPVVTPTTGGGDSGGVGTGGGNADSGGGGGGCLIPTNSGQSLPMLLLLVAGMALMRRFGLGN
ncbi:MAG: DUF5011 domain-containing protein, partial [Ghiorsea sp.]